MSAYLARRVLALFPVMLIVAAVSFTLLHLTPGDPAHILLGPDASPEAVARLRAELGLDAPLVAQFGRFVLRLARGDLGRSIFFQAPVAQVLWNHLEPTVLLGVMAICVAVAIGVPAGVSAAVHHGRARDQLYMGLALMGVSIPEFWLSLNLIWIFAVGLRWLPVAGYLSPREAGLAALRYLIMPAVAMGFVQSALIARMTRAAALEALSQDYIRTARAKGASERAVIYRHLLKNAMVNVITVIGISFSIMVGGNLAVETIFAIPGLGQLLISSVLRRDYPVIQGIVLLFTASYVVVNLLVDLAYAWIDPRIRYA